MSTSTVSCLSLAGILLVAGLALPAHAQSSPGGGAASDAFANLPSSLTLTGVVRDFRGWNVTGGHPDFQRYNTGHRTQLVQDRLDSDGKPVFNNSFGRRVSTQFRDRNGRNINPALFNAQLGDQAGALAAADTSTTITSAETFSQWYRDVQGVNMSAPVSLTLTRQTNTNRYVFHAMDNGSTSTIEGFFPINNQLLSPDGPSPGAPAAGQNNYHFTFELGTTFTYRRGSGQVFTFEGDDDVWVFIDGRLVIDLGGVHGAILQTVDLDRLTWLEDGQNYRLNFFFAERHFTRSNFRIETTLELRNVDLPPTTAMRD